MVCVGHGMMNIVRVSAEMGQVDFGGERFLYFWCVVDKKYSVCA